MSTSGDLLFLGGGSLLFHATAVVSLVFSPLFSDIGRNFYGRRRYSPWNIN